MILYKCKHLTQLLLFFLIFECTLIQAKWVDYQFPVMGTEIRMRFWIEDASMAEQAKQAVIDEMHHINNTMSPWIETSLLYRVNERAHNQPVQLTQEFYDVIQQSLMISDMTKGAFDITFSSVGYLYDYRAEKQPTETELKDKVPLINYRAIELDESAKTIRFSQQGVKIDLGGIAKGLAVDNSIKKLKSFGVKEASVTAGGDSYVLGNNAGKLWRIGIKHPRAVDKVVTVLPVADMAVSTSGDYERYFIDESTGEWVHHIINPTTGKSVKGVQSVTIMAANSTYADALSTSVFVLGVKKGLELVNKLEDVSAIIVNAEGQLFYSDDLQAM